MAHRFGHSLRSVFDRSSKSLRMSPCRESGDSSSRSSSFAKASGGLQSPISLEAGILEPEICSLLPNYNRNDKSKSPKYVVPLKSGVSYVNVKEEDQMEISGYYPDVFYTTLTWLAIICTCGLLRLVFHWRPSWMLYCTHKPCSLSKAKKVLLVDHYNQLFVEKVQTIFPPCKENSSSNLMPVINTETKNNILGNDQQLDSPALSLVRPATRGEFHPTNCLIFFENKLIRYLWDPDTKEFSKVSGLDRNVPISYFHHQKGLSEDEQSKRLILYKKNSIIVKVQSIMNILFQEVLEPFYVFQVFSVIVWYTDSYMYYASCIIVMSALSLSTSVYQIRTNQRTLRDTVHASDVVKVCRKGVKDYLDVPSDQLVPGDVLIIPRYGCVMQCDAVLINGNCIVNESMLTGESVPVTKTSVSHGDGSKIYDKKEDARYTLFCGTKVIQTRYYDQESVKAVVVRTGFLTAKGELVRSIMFPKPVDFKFNRHINRFILCLALVALIGFIFTVVFMINNGEPLFEIVIRALDLVTIIIPPALPAAMTIGIVFAQSRLKKAAIYCISPRSINISGCINCVCFDKTGTLTEDGLDLWGVVPVVERSFTLANHQPSRLGKCPFLVGMATCHSLTIIEQQLTGDPLDLKMFEATEWELEEPEIDDTAKYDIITPTIVKPKNFPILSNLDGSDEEKLPYEVGIVRQFPFSSSLQRMCVITRTLGAQHFEIYCKGAPEMVASLCNSHTVPENFAEILKSYTQEGYRVLALAFRPLPRLSYTKAQRISREDLESDLSFLGLLVMENRLKEETTPVLDVIKLAGIRTVMVTGDSILTALSVARDCHMIENHQQVVLLSVNQDNLYMSPPQLVWHFSDNSKKESYNGSLSKRTAVNIILDKPDKVHVAITGKTFAVLKEHYPTLLRKVAVSGTVFARMAPEQKQQLVELLQELGYYVGMCGDGANDCGALKAAHAGISLSETEASVASPFTSKTPNIACVPTLIREGRAALVTSFGVLKYMACYSLAQFISVIILYTRHDNLTDMEFLYVDLFLITVFVALFGRTAAFDSLSKRPPPSSLIGLAPLSSVGFQVFLILGFQLAGSFLMWVQPWYIPHVQAMTDRNLKCHDNYAVFSVSVFQYIVLAVVFSSGAPYRKSIVTNKLFLCVLLLMTAFTIYLVANPHPWLADQFDLEFSQVTIVFRLSILALATAHFLLAVFIERFFINYVLSTKCQNRRKKKIEFQLLEEETCGPPTWLPTFPLTPVESMSNVSSENSSVSLSPVGKGDKEVQPRLNGLSVNRLDLELEKIQPSLPSREGEEKIHNGDIHLTHL